MSEPQVTMTGPARLRALAADLELIRADMEAFDLRQLAALWEADLSYAAGLIADEILRAERAEAALDRATNDLMLSEESFVTMRAKRDEVLSELRTTRAALERARALAGELEWCGVDNWLECPWCLGAKAEHYGEPAGHKPDCKLAAFLADASGGAA